MHSEARITRGGWEEGVRVGDGWVGVRREGGREEGRVVGWEGRLEGERQTGKQKSQSVKEQSTANATGEKGGGVNWE